MPAACLQALIDFENVLSMEPKNYLGDDFSRVTQIYRVTQYNIACCYSMLNNEDSGLEALNTALASGAAVGTCGTACGCGLLGRATVGSRPGHQCVRHMRLQTFICPRPLCHGAAAHCRLRGL